MVEKVEARDTLVDFLQTMARSEVRGERYGMTSVWRSESKES